MTSFEFRAHPVGPEVMLAFVLYPGDRAKEILDACTDYMAGAPEDVAPLAFLGRVPGEEPFPADWHGKPFVAVAAVHPGSVAEGERVLQPLRELGDPIVDLSAAMPYVEAQSLLDEEYPNGRRYYWKSINLTGLVDGAIEQLTASAEAAPSDLSTIDIWFQGGAMARVAPEDTAFGDRRAPIVIGVEANWEGAEHDEANIAWARLCIEDLRPFGGGTYLNFPGFLEDRERMLRESYGANYDRLVAVKTRYDPTNLFRVNQNIPPAT